MAVPFVVVRCLAYHRGACGDLRHFRRLHSPPPLYSVRHRTQQGPERTRSATCACTVGNQEVKPHGFTSLFLYRGWQQQQPRANGQIGFGCQHCGLPGQPQPGAHSKNAGAVERSGASYARIAGPRDSKDDAFSGRHHTVTRGITKGVKEDFRLAMERQVSRCTENLMVILHRFCINEKILLLQCLA
ncbi:hypothetical protein AB205_0098820 [Aquarana catesbeiana]|uniref:Integrator complex subunit 10 n=1 Tax=Aquarana catesbeiana TaxID=8400 RepID=A0A2G9RLW3_AQUCT|nr:hypothetical protein AB205_0098820 [Aquarana catesbeiana]